MAPKRKIVITAALVGNGTTKEMNPNTPYSPEEIAKDAVACVKAGASIVHIHIRKPDGGLTMDVDQFKATYQLTRQSLEAEGLDAIINLSTGGYTANEERIAHIAAIQPEMCSYNPGSINWGKGPVYLNDHDLMERLGHLCQETNTKPEIEIFDSAMLDSIGRYVKEGILTTPCHFQFIMGVPSGLAGNIKNVSFLLDKMPEGSTWSITGIGKFSMSMMLLALAAGANGIRVGLEDGIWLEPGVPATNPAYVERAARLVVCAGCDVATAAEAREILGIKNPETVSL